MTIDTYAPGRRIQLSRDPATQLPRLSMNLSSLLPLAVVLVMLLVTVVKARDMFGYFIPGGEWLVPLGLIALAPLLSRYFGINPPKILLSLAADAEQGTLELRFRDEWWRTRTRTLARADVSRIELSVEGGAASGSKRAARKAPGNLEFQLGVFLEKRPLAVRMDVDAVDTRDEVLDFGARLAAVLGFEAGEIVSNDPLHAVFDFYRDASDWDIVHRVQVGEAAASAGTARRDEQAGELAQHYAADAAVEPRLQSVITRPWSPSSDPFGCKITRYEPGHRLEYVDRISWVGWIFLAALAAFVGMFLWSILLIPFSHTSHGVTHLSFSAWIMGPILAGGAVIGYALFYSKPVSWSFDFDDKTLRWRHGDEEKLYRLDKVKRVRLDVETTTRTSGSGSNRRTTTTYSGRTKLVGIDGNTPLEVASTGELDQYAKAYEAGLCFAAMMASLTGVPLRYGDQDLAPDRGQAAAQAAGSPGTAPAADAGPLASGRRRPPSGPSIRSRELSRVLLGVIPPVLIVAGVIVIVNWRDWKVGWMRKGSISYVVSVLHDPKESEELHRMAIVVLGERGAEAKPAIPVLLEAMKQDDFMIQTAAIEALGEIGSAEAVPPLEQVLHGDLMNTREAAVWALGKIGPAAAPALPTLMDRYSILGREAVLKALLQIDPGLGRVMGALMDRVRSPSVNQRFEAAALLGDLGPEREKQARPLLQELTNDSVAEVRAVAQAALKKLGPGAKPNELPAEADDRRAVGKAPGEAYAKYNQALEAKDVRQALKYVPKDKARQMEGLSDEQVYGKLQALSPLRIADVLGQALPENRVSLTVQGRLEGAGLSATGTVLMLLEDGQWKVQEERWDLH
jgi:HEAT repeat protein